MRRARVLLFLFLVAVAAIAYFGLRNGWELPSVPGQREASTGSGDAPRPAGRPDATRPTFDVVRAEPTGDMVMAGRAEPNWTVTIEANGKTVGTAVADAAGEWIIQPDKPLPKGEHALQLKSQSPKGEQMLFSKQRLALSLGAEATKGRPLVALSEEGEPTRVLQMSPPLSDEKRLATLGPNATANIDPTPPFKPSTGPDFATPQVSFTSVDYEQNEGQSAIYLGGRGTPGSKLMLYMNNEFAGTVTVDATGGWTFKATRELEAGSYALRADSVEMNNGKVLARAEVNFDRQGHKTAALEAFGPGPANGAPPAKSATAQKSPGTELAASGPVDANAPQSASADPNGVAAAADASGTGVIVVRRGDTLWQIAQRQYGNGKKFTEIFQNNKGQIRNPNLIYPSQRFSVPR
jgi:hypothetical protein